ncbi:MAG: NUDIX domain-containing protein [Methanospirillum sp.]|uniref:NUDIX domain-containing protein n=1 Tax=Methanospirillum sp. TaxID=45200 RepID=UPI00236D967D|nr:NUDIX domain-containing protein [Methanospirillum sp.]MDD1727489.1 NUDIX domain-containing protein [Methanospirillum sp.]
MTSKPFALSVRIVLFDQHGHILVLKRSKSSRTNPGKWELPGGKIDKDEAFDAALKREVLEETGFQVVIHTAAGTAMQETEEWRVVHLVMIGSMMSGGLAISSEHEEYRWASPIELGGLEKADWFEEYFRMYLQAIPAAPKESTGSE